MLAERTGSQANKLGGGQLTVSKGEGEGAVLMKQSN